MYTIGQFARICQVSPKALRHYEKLGLLVPSKVDTCNQYRYYEREQLDAVKVITILKDLGIPLKTIKTIIYEGSQPDKIENLLNEHRTNLLEQLETLNHRLIGLNRWRQNKEAKDMNKAEYDIRLRDIPETLVYSRRKKLTDFYRELPQLIRDLLNELAAAGGICSGAPLILYHDNFYASTFDPNLVDVEVGWPVNDPKYANNTLPAVRAACVTYVGPYDGLENAYAAVFEWINQNGYQGTFPTREASLNDPSVTPPEQLVTDIIIPIA